MNEVLLKRAKDAIRKVHDDRTADIDEVVEALEELAEYAEELSAMVYQASFGDKDRTYE